MDWKPFIYSCIFYFIVHMISSLTLVWLFLFSLRYFSMSGDLTATCVTKCHNFLKQPVCTTGQIQVLDSLYKVRFIKSFITMNDTDINSFICASIILKWSRSSMPIPIVGKNPKKDFWFKKITWFLFIPFFHSLWNWKISAFLHIFLSASGVREIFN